MSSFQTNLQPGKDGRGLTYDQCSQRLKALQNAPEPDLHAIKKEATRLRDHPFRPAPPVPLGQLKGEHAKLIAKYIQGGDLTLSPELQRLQTAIESHPDSKPAARRTLKAELVDDDSQMCIALPPPQPKSKSLFRPRGAEGAGVGSGPPRDSAGDLVRAAAKSSKVRTEELFTRTKLSGMPSMQGQCQVIDLYFEESNKLLESEARSQGVGMFRTYKAHQRRFLQVVAETASAENKPFTGTLKETAHYLSTVGPTSIDAIIKRYDESGAKSSTICQLLAAVKKLGGVVRRHLPKDAVEGGPSAYNATILAVENSFEAHARMRLAEPKLAKRRVKARRTVEDFAKTRQWCEPETLARLQQAALNAFRHGVKVLEGKQTAKLLKEDLTVVNQSFSVFLQLFCRTGRPGPMSALDTDTLLDLLKKRDNERFYEAFDHKLTQTRGDNPVLDFNGAVVEEVLMAYYNVYRPAVKAKVALDRRGKVGAKPTVEDTGHFLTSTTYTPGNQSKAFKAGCIKLTKGWGPEGKGFELSITNVRCILATKTEELHAQGLLPDGDKKTLHLTDNHSVQMAESTYAAGQAARLQGKGTSLSRTYLLPPPVLTPPPK